MCVLPVPGLTPGFSWFRVTLITTWRGGCFHPILRDEETVAQGRRCTAEIWTQRLWSSRSTLLPTCHITSSTCIIPGTQWTAESDGTTESNWIIRSMNNRSAREGPVASKWHQSEQARWFVHQWPSHTTELEISQATSSCSEPYWAYLRWSHRKQSEWTRMWPLRKSDLSVIQTSQPAHYFSVPHYRCCLGFMKCFYQTARASKEICPNALISCIFFFLKGKKRNSICPPE